MTATLTYDALGRRQSRLVNGTSSQFLYDRLNPIREQTGSAVVSLLTGLQIDEYFTRTDTDGTQTFLSDALGSTLPLVDGDLVRTEYTYAPFGALIVSGAPSANSFQYTGRENDGTGLYYYRARYYDPSIGRFISEDPLQFVAGPDFYVYVQNNPVLLSDPWGLRDLNGAERKGVLDAARDWAKSKVPYVTGGKSKTGGRLFGLSLGHLPAGRSAYNYLQSRAFNDHHGPRFRRLDPDKTPQPGDVGVYPGHVVIYDPGAGENLDVWSASHPGGRPFGSANQNWYGAGVHWVRYDVP